MKALSLRYKQPAERTNEGWEKYSLPIGNGYAGASIFGGTDIERIQFTTNSFANTYKMGGVSNFAEILLSFQEGAVSEYERGLRLIDGVAYSRYFLNGIEIKREAFFSYPDRVFAYRIASREAVDFEIALVIPYLGARSVDEGGRIGKVFSDGRDLVMRGELPSRSLFFEGRLSVECNGQVCADGEKLQISNATETTLFFVMDTSYRLCEEVFLEGAHCALGDDPHEALVEDLAAAKTLGWGKLYARHKADYTGLMARVEVNLGGVEDDRTTDELLIAYQKGEKSQYLEEVYYAYGRHLLISSSRKGTLPASLQGVWSVHDKSPWGSGFWHNINIQMNYWPAFTTNLAETFEAYVGFWNAYHKQAEHLAEEWIQTTNPENFQSGDCGWIIGTAAFCYEIEGRHPYQHSGPGTGGLTAKMFWDYYDFTRDECVLREVTYPAVHGMAKFLTKTVRDYEGEYLCSFSASPEQILTGDFWINQHKVQKYYHTVGCAFDQQMLYENACDDLACSKLLGILDDVSDLEQRQLEHYAPVQIGYSGQIKEYGEEHFYGEIGEAKHRHVSQLVALMPGTLITQETPAWLDAAERTLELRGDEATGWALAHRFCAWARTGNGEHAYSLLNNLLQKRTYPNLWDVHPPFQIDGNFGAVAGITEMLIQSHGGGITLFPCIPSAWKNISFKGLKARGNFTVSATYHDGLLEGAEVKSVVGGKLRLTVKEQDNVYVVCKETGMKVQTIKSEDKLVWDTEAGKTYCLNGFARREEIKQAESFNAEWQPSGVVLSWMGEEKLYTIYRAVGDAKTYEKLGQTTKTCYVDQEYSTTKKARLTYKIVVGSVSASERGAVVFMHPANKLEEERYQFRFKQTNLHTQF
ncbi:MAG: glycoside hydrolase N-terminal domain-containing protein [Clostridia bacterium]|nr:glycoside hydrolase N-terminal domain-containing protein [Clostridia bacterium]